LIGQHQKTIEQIETPLANSTHGSRPRWFPFGSSFKTRYHALKGRVGPKKAAVAVAANLLRVVYHMLKDGTYYQDLGEAYRRPRNPARAAANLANRIRALGYQVAISRAA
jgi:transposase